MIEEPVTAFGRRRQPEVAQPYRLRTANFILDPAERDAIKPNYKLLREPIKPYISTREKNRERILGMVRQSLDTVQLSGGHPLQARNSVDNRDLLRVHDTNGHTVTSPVRRETYRNEKSGAIVTKYYY